MNLSVKEKQDLLAINDLKERALETLRYMNIELQKLELKNDIQSKVRFDLDQQREYFLQQQMKTIQEELVILRKKR
jgi:ATP-dependent Lon protease